MFVDLLTLVDRLSRVVKEAPAAEASAEGETIPTKAVSTRTQKLKTDLPL